MNKKKICQQLTGQNVSCGLKPILYLYLQVEILLRELCRLHKIKMPNEATILLTGESSSGSTGGLVSGSVCGSDSGMASGSAKSVEDSIDHEAGYGSDTDISLSSLDSDDFESATRLEKKSPSKNSTDVAPPFKKAHLDVLKKIVSQNHSMN